MKKLYTLFVMLFIGNFLFAQHGTVVPIDSVQFVDQATLSAGTSAPIYFSNDGVSDTITIEGVVNFTSIYYGMSTNRKATWLQDTSFKPFGAINVFIDPNQIGYSGSLGDLNDDVKFYENFIAGYRVKCTGILSTYDGNTQLNLLPIESEIIDIPSSIDTAMPVEPVVLGVDIFMKNDGSGGQDVMYTTGEQYEGRMVQFNDVTVVDVSGGPDRYYWFVQDSKGNKIGTRDVSAYYRNDNKHDAPWANITFTPPSIGTRLKYIRGAIMESLSGAGGTEFRIAPIYPTDLSIAAAAPFISKVSRYPVVASSSDEVKIMAEISDNDGSIVNAELFYSIGLGNKSFFALPMNNLGGNKYSVKIPPAADGEYVNFYIRAIDDSSLVAYFPDSLATGSMYRVIDKGITEISDIQETPFTSGNSLWDGDTLSGISLKAVVTGTLSQLGYVSIQNGTDPYSGIFIKAIAGDGLSTLKIGDSIEIKSAIVSEIYGVTYLENAGNNNFELLSINNAIPEPVKNIPPDSLNAQIPEYAEAYEAMLLQFDDIYVVNNNPDAPNNYGEWAIGYDTSKSNGYRVDDYSNFIVGGFNVDSLSEDMKLDFIRGIATYSFGNCKLLPRDLNDISGFNTEYVLMPDFSSDVNSGNSPLDVNFYDNTTNSPIPTTYNWEFDGGSPATSIERNPVVTYNTVGNYDVKMKVMNADATDSVTKKAYITVTGIKELNNNIRDILIFPNPTTSKLIIKGSAKASEKITVSIYNQLGKKLYSDEKAVNENFNFGIDVAKFNKGIYIIEFVAKDGSKAARTFIKN